MTSEQIKTIIRDFMRVSGMNQSMFAAVAGVPNETMSYHMNRVGAGISLDTAMKYLKAINHITRQRLMDLNPLVRPSVLQDYARLADVRFKELKEFYTGSDMDWDWIVQVAATLFNLAEIMKRANEDEE